MCNKLEDHLEIFDTSSPVFGNTWIKTPDAGILGCLYIWGLLERFVVLWLRKTFWAEWRFLQEDGDSIWISRVGLIGGYCVFLEGWLHMWWWENQGWSTDHWIQNVDKLYGATCMVEYCCFQRHILCVWQCFFKIYTVCLFRMAVSWVGIM